MADNFDNSTMVYRAGSDETVGTTGGIAGVNKLWLPLWSGEVIHAYDQYNIFENMIQTKSLTGGFAWEFPVTGTVALKAAWSAGEELVGGSNASQTFKVVLDKRPIAAHFETDNVDLLVAQWDYRSNLARQAGQTLANARDKQLISALIAATFVAPLDNDPRGIAFPDPVNINSGGTAAFNAAPQAPSDTMALELLQAIENYVVLMQNSDFPTNDIHCVVSPKVFQVIRALGIPRSATFGSGATLTSGFVNNPLFTGGDSYGGSGGALNMGMNAMADTLDYMGVKICKTNHIPRTDITVGELKYNLPALTAAIDIFGFIFQKEAIAGLSLQGMKVDTVQDVRRNTQFTVASMLKGTGIIRPELCQLIVGSNTTRNAAAIDSRSEVETLYGNAADVWSAEYAATSTTNNG